MEGFMNVIVPLAEGFEEIEAVTIIDVLRRASIPVTIASVGTGPVKGVHGIIIAADKKIGEIDGKSASAIILPGGGPGAGNLKKSPAILSLIQDINSRKGCVAAICAAPIVLAAAGILRGKTVTCFPGFENELQGTTCAGTPVHVDGNIITGKGPACAIPFALKIVELLRDKGMADKIRESLQVYWPQT
jgi:4-methyl-5(b-hydroxyethyl)-thiazole monophosphate biosynthesis